MTPEEAGQIILENKPWDTCNNCNNGWAKDSPTSSMGTSCPKCRGFGVTHNPAHKEACELLGLPMPAKPPSTLKKLVDIPIARESPMKLRSK